MLCRAKPALQANLQETGSTAHWFVWNLRND